MRMGCRQLAIAWLLALLSLPAQAFFDTPYVTPANPHTNETVYVSLRSGECDSTLSLPGYPQITRQGTSINVRFWGARATDPEFCYYPVGTRVQEVGAFPPGNYVLIVELAYQSRQPPSGVHIDTLGVVPFTVVGGPTPSTPIGAPTLGMPGLFLIALLLASAAAFTLRKRSHWLLALALLAPGARAQEAPPMIAVLTLDAATAAAVADYYRSPQRSGPPPLQGLSVGNPTLSTYLLPLRASGEFLARLEAHPNSVRAKLERMLAVTYPEGTDLTAPLAALRADAQVLSASVPPRTTPSSVELSNFQVIRSGPQSEAQYGRTALNIDAAWAIAGGHALIAVVDTGLQTSHPALKPFNGTAYTGGPFKPVLSLDISQTGLIPMPQNSMNVDERRPMPVLDSACNTDPKNHPNMQPVRAGHGTHVTGLITTSNTGLSVQGTCKNCSIAMWKTNYATCAPSGEVILSPNSAAEDAAVALAGDIGAQVTNMSFGSQLYIQGPPPYCTQYADDPLCLAMAHSRFRDVAMVAASGNNKRSLNFPASSTEYAIAAGGFQQNLALWDLSPGSSTNCPVLPAPAGYECGSNWTNPNSGSTTIFPEQELVASAQSVLSTTYTGYNWINSYTQCGDGFGTPMGDGVGTCTGTSMSAPQISGILGILRSINPLVRTGSPSTAGSLRQVMAATTAQAQLGQSWEPHLGYGRPDAAAAARALLGKVAGAPALNRATPLFRLYSAFEDEYADTTVPQMATALLINQTNAWNVPLQLRGNIPGYSTFPHDPADGTIDTPGASAYVLATEARVRNEWPALVPLHLMTKPVPNSGIPPRAQDYLLATSKTEIEQTHLQGYELLSIQGYVYAPCSPDCKPPGTQILWRAWKAASADCATFLDEEKDTFHGAGYIGNCPGTTTQKLGYAYSNADRDHDGLPDAVEYVAGSNPDYADSDGDGLNDVVEYPMVGIPQGDPCAGGLYGSTRCGADVIFRYGHESQL